MLPSRQGQGIGTRALTAALKETDELGVPVFLCTQEERNVTFYRRLGFRPMREVGSDLRSVADRVVWGGDGTIMEVHRQIREGKIAIVDGIFPKAALEILRRDVAPASR